MLEGGTSSVEAGGIQLEAADPLMIEFLETIS
jgi:hypothetical protein